MTNAPRPVLRLVTAALVLLGVACGHDDDDLPPGWDGARRLALVQSSCSSSAGPELNRLQLSPGAGGTIGVAFQTTLLRCGQEACAYAVDFATTTKLLVQPCDMHPHAVGKCACTTQVNVSLPAADDRRTVELWLRPDHYGQHGDNLPALVDSQPVTATCAGENPALACRPAPGGCVPSACTCSSAGWACTADCGGGRTCPDAGVPVTDAAATD